GMPRRPLGVEDAHLLGQPLDDSAVVLLAEIGLEPLDHGVADLIDRIEFLAHVGVAGDESFASFEEGAPGAVGSREHARRGLADVADAERVEEALERDIAPCLDRAEQISHRGLAVAFLLLEPDFLVALLQRENIGRLPHPALLVEELDLLLAETVDIERAARHEMLEMLDRLMRPGELPTAARYRAALSGPALVPDHPCVRMAPAALRE